jgi:beta-mannosidase
MPRNVGELGRAYETVRLWLKREPLELDWEEYAFCSALLQAEGLQEYIANYRRRMYSSASAIFWMYNDSWPVTHGWTIVDYYRRRKLAYHPVRRAFQPVTVVVAEEADQVLVTGVNDTPVAWSGHLRFGLFRLAGGYPRDEGLAVELPANAATVLGCFPRAAWEALGTQASGAFAVLSQDGQTVAQHRLFVRRFHELEFAPADVRLSRCDDVLTLSCDTFAWGICLDLDGERPLTDNCFDLLPALPYRLGWPAACGEPTVMRIGSRDAVLKGGRARG